MKPSEILYKAAEIMPLDKYKSMCPLVCEISIQLDSFDLHHIALMYIRDFKPVIGINNFRAWFTHEWMTNEEDIEFNSYIFTL